MDWVVAAVIIGTVIYSMHLQSKLAGQAPGSTIQGPTASEGVAIPVVFGTRQITDPNVCWYGNQKDTNSDGTHYYSLDAQVALCHGKIDKLIDVVTNNKRTMYRIGAGGLSTDPIVDDNTQFQAGQIGEHPDSAKFSMEAVVHTGAVNNAGTDPGIADSMAAAMGLATGPKYFGVAWLQGKFRLGTSPLFMPVECIVQRIHYRLGGSTQWYDSKAEIATGRALGDLWKYKLQDAADYSDWSGVSFDDSAWAQAAGPISNAPTVSVLMDYADYPLPLVKTQLPVDGTYVLDGGTFFYGNKYSGGKVQEGCKLWLRWNFGSLPPINIFAQLWHDDSAKLFFNGTEIAISPTHIDTLPNNERFNATAAIPASLINTSGPNVVAMRVMDSYASVFGAFTRGAKTGTNQLLFAGLQIGNDTSVPGKLVDMNPAHIIHEVLTDTIWGMGYSDGDLDDDSFRAAADTLYAENFGMSLVWSQQSTHEDFITEILRHISGVLYVARDTGLFTLKLIREDYTVGALLVLDETKIVKVEALTRKEVGELVNSVTVTYSATPRGDQGSLTIFEEGLLQIQGGTVSSKIDYPGVTNSFIAGNLALRDLRALSTPLVSCTIYCSRHAAGLHIGDPFVLNWPDLFVDNFVMRVATIDVGDGINNTVKITCIEDVFFYPNQRVTATNAPIARPVGPIKSTLAPQETYHTCKEVDTRDKGVCEAVFWANKASTYLVEVSPGVIEAPAAGPFAESGSPPRDTFFDGLSADAYNTSGVSWLIGKRVLLWDDIAMDDATKRLCGPYIVDDVGGHWENYGTLEQVYVDTKFRAHRDPLFSTSDAFTAQATFGIRNGLTYAGHYIQLQSTSVVLGTTPLEFADQGTSMSFADSYYLLKTSQLSLKAIPLDTIDMSATFLAGAADFSHAFPTLPGTPGAKSIPAGVWTFQAEAAWLDPTQPGDVGSVTTLGFKVYRDGGSSGAVLFEVLSAQITATTPASVPAIAYIGPQYLLETTDRLVLIPTMHTDSTTAVKLWLRYNSATLGTTVKIPIPGALATPTAASVPVIATASAMSLDGPSKYTILGPAGNHTTAIGLPNGVTMGASVLMQVPNDAKDGTMLVCPVWAPSADATSGAVRWQVTVSVVGSGAISTPGTATPWTGDVATVETPFVADKPFVETGIRVAAVAAGSWLRIGLQRIGADSADTYAGQANLLSVQINY